MSRTGLEEVREHGLRWGLPKEAVGWLYAEIDRLNAAVEQLGDHLQGSAYDTKDLVAEVQRLRKVEEAAKEHVARWNGWDAPSLRRLSNTLEQSP